MPLQNPTLPLSELLQRVRAESPVKLLQVYGLDSSRAVSGIALDSRKVQPGDLFFALGGVNVDGHRFIPDAIQRGAAAVVGAQPMEGLAAPYIQVSDSRQALAYFSAAFYSFPARRLVMIGVTGTDGKTTTSNLIFRILQAARIQAGMISTVNAVIGEEFHDTGFHVTTPEAPDVQRYLAEMVSAGMTHAVLEATSHGLAQQRLAACEFDTGIVTNITHEHLDYHGSYEQYREAKASLFRGLSQSIPKSLNPPRAAVLNRDDGSYEYLSSVTGVDLVSYGLRAQAMVQATDIVYEDDGVRFLVSGPDFNLPIKSSLVGEFNISNCLAAIASARLVFRLDLSAIREGIEAMKAVPGRMERVDLGQDFTAIVDFAHTPNALRRALEAVHQQKEQGKLRGRVIAVFGSAGLRDRAKRRMMAETAAELADLTVLTAEDPRTEVLQDILAEMAAGAESRSGVEGETFWRVPDRREAIRFAVSLARPGDVVILCGKGHEQSMCFGDIEYAWDDRVALRAALAERLGIPGPEMPYLPDV